MNENIIDYLFNDIIKDIKYAHKHRNKISKLPVNETKLKLKLFKSVQKTLENNEHTFKKVIKNIEKNDYNINIL